MSAELDYTDEPFDLMSSAALDVEADRAAHHGTPAGAPLKPGVTPAPQAASSSAASHLSPSFPTRAPWGTDRKSVV